MITGINHLTFSVRELSESVQFYSEVLGARLLARWDRGAYLQLGNLWLALQVDPLVRSGSLPEYTHVAFSVSEADFEDCIQRIIDSGASIWKDNQSEGASLYFEDPNGHKLEIHASNLESRLAHAKKHPWGDIEFSK